MGPVIQHEIARNYLISAAYVGMKGTHLYHSRDSNPAVYGPGATLANTQQRRLYPWIGRIQEERSDSYSNHHALQLSLEKRFSQGFTLLSNYTFGKTLGLTWGRKVRAAMGCATRGTGHWTTED